MNELNKQEEVKIWTPEGAQYLKDKTAYDQLKIAIIGPPKGGKSRLAATAPRKPIYFFDRDNRLQSLAGLEGVIGKHYNESTNPTKAQAWKAMEQDMSMFEMNKLQGKPLPGTIVFDSMTTIIGAAEREIVCNDSGVRKSFKIGTKEFYVPGGSNTYAYYREEMNLIGNFIQRGVELGCDVITIFHERAEEAVDSTDENPKYTGKVSVHPPRTANLLILFDQYWRVLPEAGRKYRVTTAPTYDFIGGSTLLIDDIEDADIGKMIEKHNLNMKAKGVK